MGHKMGISVLKFPSCVAEGCQSFEIVILTRNTKKPIKTEYKMIWGEDIGPNSREGLLGEARSYLSSRNGQIHSNSLKKRTCQCCSLSKYRSEICTHTCNGNSRKHMEKILSYLLNLTMPGN